MTAVTRQPGAQVDDRRTPAVRVHGLRKAFGSAREPVLALDGLDLDVEAGEFVTVLGASGCGKSTLLRLLAGLDQPTSGEVDVQGGQPALMFQESALMPWLTAEGNLQLALRLAGVPRQERAGRCNELLNTVRLGNVASRRVHELSGGQRQRVALARSLAQGSRVLLMDEPFAALDAITRDLLHQELLDVWRADELSIVFVTHNVREAVLLGQRIVLLSSRPGRVLRTWDTRDVPQDDVAALTEEITHALREEIGRHAHA